jgi:hypothetical protein
MFTCLNIELEINYLYNSIDVWARRGGRGYKKHVILNNSVTKSASDTAITYMQE